VVHVPVNGSGTVTPLGERLVVQSGDSTDHDRLRVEDLLAARDGASRPADAARRSRRVHPRREQTERTRIERRAGWIEPDRIVDPDEERLGRQPARPARRAVRAKRPGSVAHGLRREQRRFERDDRLLLSR
jgi:hypothetical protein